MGLIKVKNRKFIWISTIIFLVILNSLFLGKYIYFKNYVNGNNIDNIQRSIAWLYRKDINKKDEVHIASIIEYPKEKIVTFRHGNNYGISEFLQENKGNYKIKSCETRTTGQIQTYIFNSIVSDKMMFLIYGNGSDLNIGKFQVKVNDVIKEFDIPQAGDFIYQINLDEIDTSKENAFRYEYKYFDREGKEIKLDKNNKQN